MAGISKSKAPRGTKTTSEPLITATSQTSRFHADTLITLSKEVDLKQVNISIGNRDLLVDAHLRLKSNVAYGLVGRNGQGKSTLLKAIAEKLIPGIAENIRILLVGQVEETEPVTVSPPKATVVDHVLKSHLRRETALWEYNILRQAIESASHHKQAKALATVIHGRETKALQIAAKTANKRSGARGAEARKQLLVAEARLAEAEATLSRLSLEDRADSSMDEEAEMADIAEEMQTMFEGVNATLESLNSDATEANTRTILLGLGFSQEQLDAPFESLSGGWRSRCVLASALVQTPDILILDEPTNYLDIPSVIWLQHYLQSLEETTILVVAHDRDFLDTVTQETIMLRAQKLLYYEGGISACERANAKKRKNKLKMRMTLDKKREAVERSISESMKTARKTGDDNKARMARSRQRKLDERWGAEVNEKGHRFKLNRDMPTYHLTNRLEIEVDDLDPPINIAFPNPERMRFPGSLCSATDVSFRYSNKLPLILDSVNLVIHPGDRVGLVGKNGQGKSTLVKLLTGELKPTKGVVERHPRLRFGYYSQHSVEDLSKGDLASSSALQHFTSELQRLHNVTIDEGTSRSFLGSFGLHGQTAASPIGTLSGGQKVRLALALVVYPAPDLLILDEVSTHLDMDTTAGLIRALRGFDGAVLLVSHDRHLVRCVIEGGPLLPPSEMDDEGDEDDDSDDGDDKRIGKTYRVGPKGALKILNGGVADYVAIVERRLKRGL